MPATPACEFLIDYAQEFLEAKTGEASYAVFDLDLINLMVEHEHDDGEWVPHVNSLIHCQISVRFDDDDQFYAVQATVPTFKVMDAVVDDFDEMLTTMWTTVAFMRQVGEPSMKELDSSLDAIASRWGTTT